MNERHADSNILKCILKLKCTLLKTSPLSRLLSQLSESKVGLRKSKLTLLAEIKADSVRLKSVLFLALNLN